MNTPHKAHSTVSVWPLWCAAWIAAGCDTSIDYDARPGLNWALSTFTGSALFILFLRSGGKSLSWQRLLPLGFACAISAGAALTTNGGLDALIIIGVGGSLAAGLLLGSDALAPQSLGAAALLLSPATAAFRTLQEAGSRVREVTRRYREGRNLAAVRGVALALPITLGLALLLSHAEPVMASWRDEIMQALAEFSYLGRLTFFFTAGAFGLGYLGQALRPAAGPTLAGRWNEGTRERLVETERLIVLTAVVSLFALFFLLQLSHLFGTAAGARGTGVTYAQTAHEGFAELTLAASLSVALTVTLLRSAGAIGLATREKWLSVVLTVQSQILLLSALYRLDRYEEVYGYTELRLLVQCYEVCVFVALGLLALELLWGPDVRRLARRCAVTGLSALIVLLYWNYPAWIAHANLARYARSGRLDVRYLVQGLGGDAVPELTRALPALPASLQLRLRLCLQAHYATRHVPPFVQTAWYEWRYRQRQMEQALARAGLAPSVQAIAPPVPKLDPCVQ